MSSSFSSGATAVLPAVVSGYSADRNSRHTFQDVVGGGQDVWAQPAGLRSGTLIAVFAGYDDAATLCTLLAGTSPVTFADSDRPYLGMTFLANGTINMTLDEQTQAVWLVSVDFQEVVA